MVEMRKNPSPLSAISAIRETSKRRLMLIVALLCPAQTGFLRLPAKIASAEHWLADPGHYCLRSFPFSLRDLDGPPGLEFARPLWEGFGPLPLQVDDSRPQTGIRCSLSAPRARSDPLDFDR